MFASDHVSRQAVFYFFWQQQHDATTKLEHSKQIIELLQNITVPFSDMSNVWKNTNGCTKKYWCATAIYLLSILEHAYNITIDRGVGETGHGRGVVDGLNATNFIIISMLMKNLQLPGDTLFSLSVQAFNARRSGSQY